MVALAVLGGQVRSVRFEGFSYLNSTVILQTTAGFYLPILFRDES